MSLVNAFGKIGLDATLVKIANYLQQLANTIGRSYPDHLGRLRVNVEAGTLNTINSVSSVSSITTLATLTNQTQQSGYATNFDQYAQLTMCAQVVRAQIKVS